MKIQDEIKSLKSRLEELRSIDKNLNIFGTSEHKYFLNDPVSESTVSAFERRFDITLPEDYRNFLLLVGNGGAGPILRIRNP